MNKKVLFCATVDFHFEKFHLPYMKWFKEQGWEVHVAARGELHLPYVDQKFDLDIQRSPFRFQNIKAYRDLKRMIEKNNYKLIHCHTPMGGVLARLAAIKARSQGTRVFYTAHGFHFYKGAPKLNWLVYYPIEKMLAHATDCLITINNEDYMRASQNHFKAGQIKHVHGVGINTERFRPVSKLHKGKLRESFGYGPDDFLLFYAAEFNKNKNHQLLINALAKMKDKIPHAKLLLAGEGPLMFDALKLANDLGVGDMVDFLGYQNKVLPYLQMSDIAVASSLREGLPVNVMESMACGLPVIATENRGHCELVQNDVNGRVVSDGAVKDFSDAIVLLAQNNEVRNRLGIAGRHLIEQKYSVERVQRELNAIYLMSFEEGGDQLLWVNQ